MSAVRMVMFDLAGTTVRDENYVAKCLHRAAVDVGIDVSLEEIGKNIGTNKRDLYKMLIARWRGDIASLEQLGTLQVSDADAALAEEAFHLYERYMLELYSNDIQEVPGASDTFRWLHDHDIKVATDTGFHKQINEAIMHRLGWLRDGLVDVALDVQDIPGERGRPTPYMIFRAMEQLGITSVHDVVKVGDQPADMMEGTNAGCRAVIGVLSGPLDAVTLGVHRHTHLLPSVAMLPQLFESEGWV
ncbi:HAD family hydrolase [Aeoliella mucimassa]|uniref:HAD family hydrolase n=1 Tax=Aeoliella mucimassa TaxID=2527972 RepID=UPI0018D2C4DB|nr:HAD family hydrolase [Aeoliella mucimassa]